MTVHDRSAAEVESCVNPYWWFGAGGARVACPDHVAVWCSLILSGVAWGSRRVARVSEGLLGRGLIPARS